MLLYFILLSSQYTVFKFSHVQPFRPITLRVWTLRCNISKYSSRRWCYPSFFKGSQHIEFVEKWPHSGHIITIDCDDSEDLNAKKRSLIGQMNKIICIFRNVNCFTKTKLVKSYCTSFYGAKIWDLSHSDVESLCITWRKEIRRVFHLPYTTHSV
jgi:hypothetical protein